MNQLTWNFHHICIFSCTFIWTLYIMTICHISGKNPDFPDSELFYRNQFFKHRPPPFFFDFLRLIARSESFLLAGKKNPVTSEKYRRYSLKCPEFPVFGIWFGHLYSRKSVYKVNIHTYRVNLTRWIWKPFSKLTFRSSNMEPWFICRHPIWRKSGIWTKVPYWTNGRSVLKTVFRFRFSVWDLPCKYVF